jgi:hypothetical protein
MKQKQGRRPRAIERCGVYIASRGEFCDLPVRSWWSRRCEYHTRALKEDSIFDTLRYRMHAKERKIALDTLDKIQKTRPHWVYRPPEGRDEESLIREQEARDQAAKTSGEDSD